MEPSDMLLMELVHKLRCIFDKFDPNYRDKYVKKMHGKQFHLLWKAQIEGESGKTDTYKSLLQKCVRLAIHLKKLGLCRGEIISLWSDSNLDATVPLIAAQFIAANTFSVEPDQTPQDVGNLMFKQLRPKMVFTTKKLCPKVRQALEISEVPAKIFVFEENEFVDIIHKEDENEDNFSPVYTDDLNETALFHFTSGSTGLPKIVRQSHYFLFAADGEMAKLMGCYENETCVMYTDANWFWGVCTQTFVMSILHGACRVMGETYDVRRILDYTERYKITDMLLVPPILNNLKNNAELVQKYDTSSLRTIATTGQNVHASCMQMVRNLLPHVTIFNFYGQTEVSTVTLFDVQDPYDKQLMSLKPTSAGRPLAGFEYKIVNPESGETLGKNQKGELRLKLKRCCEYLDRDSSENFDAFGWYKTGDIGYYDDEFCFFIVDRIKDEFKYDLWHISPRYLENIILNHSAVAKVVVVGKPHEIDGALPTALIILKDDSRDTTSEEIIKFVEKQVDDRMRLRGGVRFLQSFPLTPTKKVDKLALRKMIENEK